MQAIQQPFFQIKDRIIDGLQIKAIMAQKAPDATWHTLEKTQQVLGSPIPEAALEYHNIIAHALEQTFQDQPFLMENLTREVHEVIQGKIKDHPFFIINQDGELSTNTVLLTTLKRLQKQSPEADEVINSLTHAQEILHERKTKEVLTELQQSEIK